MDIRITVIIENLPSQTDPVLLHEHGLSLLVQIDDHPILFDTGLSGRFVLNAGRLGLDLGKVEAVILSHAHFDHSGGLLALLKHNPTVPLYMGPDAGDTYISRWWFRRRTVGVDPRIFEEYAGRIQTVDNSVKIVDNVYIISGIEHNYPLPRGNQLLFKQTGDKLSRDSFDHEVAMVIAGPEGLVIITGCSHNGVLNMVQTVKNRFSGQPVRALIGGFHFIGSTLPGQLAQTEREITEIARQLMVMGVQKIYTNHCTTEKGYLRLKEVLGNRVDYLRTGDVLNI